MALAFASATFIWFATAPWPQTPDGVFHLQRVRALSEALATGVLYPRWFPDFAFGYGYPVFNYYAPLFYYPPALLHLAGLDAVTATRLTLALVYALGGLGAFRLLLGWVGLLPALAGAVLYQLFPYRLYDLFVRGALPEFAAFLWLPWIAYFTAQIVRRNDAEGDGWLGLAARRPFLLAAFAWTALILTHNLTAFMAAVALLIAWPHASLAQRDASPDRYPARLLRSGLQLFPPLLLAGLLSAWYVLPAILEAGWVALGAAGTSDGYANHFATVGALFDWSWRFPYPDAAAPTVPLPGYVLIALLLAAVLAWSAARRRQPPRISPVILILSAITTVAVWLTTAASAFVWELLAPLLSNLQFPWRWQTLVGLGAAGLAAASLSLLPVPRRWRQGIALTALAGVAVYGLAGLPVARQTAAPPEVTVEAMWAFDREMGQVGATWTGEFLPRAVTEPRWSIGREPSEPAAMAAPPAATLQVQPRQIGYLDRVYAARTDAPVQLRFQRFYFPAWTVWLDGARVPTTAAGPLGLLSVDLPPGEHVITLRWGATAAVWLGRVLAGLAWLLVLGLMLLGVPHRRLAVAGWLIVGGLGLLSITGASADVVSPTAVDADFGPVRLEASAAPPVRAGESAYVRLYWTVQEASAGLIAFVHVVDAGGAVVAQQDEVLAGLYTPPARWTPGLLLEHAHAVALPADLPPGGYTLKAGVYRPGQTDAPLVAAGASDPRVDIGLLEVQP